MRLEQCFSQYWYTCRKDLPHPSRNFPFAPRGLLTVAGAKLNIVAVALVIPSLLFISFTFIMFSWYCALHCFLPPYCSVLPRCFFLRPPLLFPDMLYVDQCIGYADELYFLQVNEWASHLKVTPRGENIINGFYQEENVRRGHTCIFLVLLWRWCLTYPRFLLVWMVGWGYLGWPGVGQGDWSTAFRAQPIGCWSQEEDLGLLLFECT